MNDTYLDETMHKWIHATACREHWRISWYSMEDLIQDGFVCYSKCKSHYRELANVKQPNNAQRRWFMSLVQRTFLNHINTLAKYNPLGQEVSLWTSDAHGETKPIVEPAQPEEASLFTVLMNTPAELRDLLDKLIQDSIDGSAYLCRRLKHGSIRETTKERWMRKYGDAEQVEELIDYLKRDSGERQLPKSKYFKQLAAESRRYQHERFKRLAEMSLRYQQEHAK